VPAHEIFRVTLATMAPPTINGIQIRHTWFVAIFLLCGVIVLSNLVHYVVFHVLRRKEK
jgi:hypothetical protein